MQVVKEADMADFSLAATAAVFITTIAAKTYTCVSLSDNGEANLWTLFICPRSWLS